MTHPTRDEDRRVTVAAEDDSSTPNDPCTVRDPAVIMDDAVHYRVDRCDDQAATVSVVLETRHEEITEWTRQMDWFSEIVRCNADVGEDVIVGTHLSCWVAECGEWAFMRAVVQDIRDHIECPIEVVVDWEWLGETEHWTPTAAADGVPPSEILDDLVRQIDARFEVGFRDQFRSTIGSGLDMGSFTVCVGNVCRFQPEAPELLDPASIVSEMTPARLREIVALTGAGYQDVADAANMWGIKNASQVEKELRRAEGMGKRRKRRGKRRRPRPRNVRQWAARAALELTRGRTIEPTDYERRVLDDVDHLPLDRWDTDDRDVA